MRYSKDFIKKINNSIDIIPFLFSFENRKLIKNMKFQLNCSKFIGYRVAEKAECILIAPFLYY
jgi:hypothetical protein